jgi:hypothetical protein
MKIQISLFCLAIAYSAITLTVVVKQRMKTKKFMKYLIPIIYVLLLCSIPSVQLMIITFNSDIFSAIFFLIFTTQVIKIIVSKGEYFQKWTSILTFSFNAFFLINLRTQYIFTIILVLILLFIVVEKARIFQLMSVLIIFMLSFGWNMFLKIENIESASSREVLSQPFQMVGAVYKNNGYMTDSEKQFFNKFGDENWWKINYNSVNADKLRLINAPMPKSANTLNFVTNTAEVCLKNIGICRRAFYDQSKVWYNWTDGGEYSKINYVYRNFDLHYEVNHIICSESSWSKAQPYQKIYKSKKSFVSAVDYCWENSNTPFWENYDKIRLKNVPIRNLLSKEEYRSLLLNFYKPFVYTNSTENRIRLNYENFWNKTSQVWGNFALPFWLMAICAVIVVVTRRWRSLILLAIPFTYWLTLVCFGTVNYLYRLVFPMTMIMPFVFVACFCLERDNLSYKRRNTLPQHQHKESFK